MNMLWQTRLLIVASALADVGAFGLALSFAFGGYLLSTVIMGATTAYCTTQTLNMWQRQRTIEQNLREIERLLRK